MKRILASFLVICLGIVGVDVNFNESRAALRAVAGFNQAAVAITGGTIDGATIGGATPAAITGTTITATTAFVGPNGAAGTPAYKGADADTGIYFDSGQINFSVDGVNKVGFGNQWIRGGGTTGASGIAWGSTVGGEDVVMLRSGANQWRFGGSNATTTSRTEINKAIASIADATPTATFTFTIPNAAHSGSALIRATCSLGAGGAIGANEATATNTYVVAFTRTPGVNATAAISAADGAAATAVAGAATVTATVAMSAVSGAVGATNTFTANVTVTKSGGSSANHTCLMYGQLMNANATGITIS